MNLLKNINVKKQLLICFASVIIVFTIANIFAIFTILSLERTSNKSYSRYVTGLYDLNGIDISFANLQLEVSRLNRTYNNRIQSLNDLQHPISMVEHSLNEYSSFLYNMGSTTRIEMFDVFKDRFYNEYMSLISELQDAINTGDEGAIEQALDNVIIYGEEISVKIQELLAYTIDNIGDFSKNISVVSRVAFYIATYTTLFAIVLSLAIAALFGRSFSKRIMRLSESAQRIASGDLNATLGSKSKDELGILSRDIDVIANTIKSITVDIKSLSTDHEQGKISTVLDSSKYEGGFAEIIISINNTVKGLTGDIGTFLHVVAEFSQGNFSATIPPLPGEKSRFNEVLDTMRDNLTSINKEITQLISFANNGDLSYRSNASFSGDWESMFLGLNLLMSTIEKPINEVISILTELSKGNFEKEITTDYKGDFDLIKDASNSTSSTLKVYIREISDTLNKMANNDLDVTITSEYVGDFIEIKDAINTIVDKLNIVFNDFNSSADQVLYGARQMSESNLLLSEGATIQSQSVRTLNDIIGEISKQIQTNVEKSKEIRKLSEKSKASANIGDKAMKDMLRSMEKISDSSKSIEQIIKVIDDIAFQTNLLALNAAVEAARAGEHGKGFAVVAEEVRSLAARSQEAAKKTNELILSSLEDVSEGTKLAISTDKALCLIIESIEKKYKIITEVSDLSKEQSDALVKINSGIEEVSSVVESNVASAEEGAASSEELSSQSEMLKNMIAAFNLK